MTLSGGRAASRVVSKDGPYTIRVGNHCVAAGAAQDDIEVLVVLLLLVPFDGDGEGLCQRPAGAEGQISRLGYVVASSGCRAVLGGVIDGHRLVIRRRKGHGESQQLRATVPFGDTWAADAEARLVIHDVPKALRRGTEGRVGCAGEVDVEVLVVFGEAVANNLHGDV